MPIVTFGEQKEATHRVVGILSDPKIWRFESAGRGWIELLDLGFVEVSEDIVLVTGERNDDSIRFSSPVRSQLMRTLFGENDFDQSK